MSAEMTVNLLIAFAILFFALLLFIVFRDLVCWYFRFSSIDKKLEAVEFNTGEIARLLRERSEREKKSAPEPEREKAGIR